MSFLLYIEKQFYSLHSWWCGEKSNCMSCLSQNKFMLPGEPEVHSSTGWILMKPLVVAAGSFCQFRIFKIFLTSSLCQNFCIRMAVQSAQSLQDTKVLVISTRGVRSDNPSNFFVLPSLNQCWSELLTEEVQNTESSICADNILGPHRLEKKLNSETISRNLQMQ